jgi:integrase
MATVRKKRGRWSARYKDSAGKWREKAVPQDSNNRATALSLAFELEGRDWRIREGLQVAPSKETVAAAAKRYLHAIRKHRSVKSITCRWNIYILPAIGEKSISLVKPTDIEAILSKMEDSAKGQWTRRHVRSTLSAFYNWLIKDRQVPSNPVDQVEGIPMPESKPKAITEEEVLRVAAGAGYEGLRNLIKFGFYTVARPGELCAATWGDLDMESNPPTFHVQRTQGSNTTKTGKSRIVVLAPAAVALLQEMKAAAPKTEKGALRYKWLFLNSFEDGPITVESAGSAFTTALKRAGFVSGYRVKCPRTRPVRCTYQDERQSGEAALCPKCGGKLYITGIAINLTPKDLRSSGITATVERTGSLHVASVQAGHSTEAMTRRHYVKANISYIATAMAAVFPAPTPPAPPPANVVPFPTQPGMIIDPGPTVGAALTRHFLRE